MTKSVDAFRSKSDNLEKEIEEVVKLSQYDFLTGAYNRNMISMEINQLLSDRRNLSKRNTVLMFDLDNFKYINDTFGHDKGDEILKIIADLVQDRKRDQDIFARWGGDEFMMLLPSTNLRQANFFAEKMRQRIEAHPVLRRNNITCSFGITQIDTQKSEEEIFKQVDIALYEAKNQGRNCVKNFGEETTLAVKVH
jgi:diguanylate cyclase (GGDEF)-like protein